jgi:two-component system LytT family response regulator
MPEIGGFEVLQSIPDQQMPAIIFTTAYDQHALKAFEVHALDYLLKPFQQERFKQALDRARTQLAKSSSHTIDPGLATLLARLRTEQSYLNLFMVKSASRVVFVKAIDVDWIEAAANYALLHVAEKTHILRQTMRELESRLCPKMFQRISRSVIVNLQRVKELQPMGKGEYVILLTNGKQLTMSRGIRDLQSALG